MERHRRGNASNQICSWESEFLKNAAAVFYDQRTENLKTGPKEKERGTDSLYKKAGQSTWAVNWPQNPENCTGNGNLRGLSAAQSVKAGQRESDISLSAAKRGDYPPGSSVADIIYIKLRYGSVCLTAMADWYSRCIVG